jgi:xanthine dehydrogenase YagS FAD-binding subunit
MNPFKYTRAADAAAATRSFGSNPKARLLAGGTNLLDLMKEQVEQPDELVDISAIVAPAPRLIASGPNTGGISISALAKNTDTANHPLIRQHYPILSQAILAGASAQIRNMATNGGNLNQRTRCPYFYEVAMPCNKRTPGSGCGALEGFNRMHAIFGWSEQCVAVHPSDMCVALAALDAVVQVQDATGRSRSIPMRDYHRLPSDHPEKDNTLTHGELITSIDIPKNEFAENSYYLKIRDRASYAFALISVAAMIQRGEQTVKQARIALGGVAHKPWRAFKAEAFLTGKEASEENFRKAAILEMTEARPLAQNSFKIEMAIHAITMALTKAVSPGGKA